MSIRSRDIRDLSQKLSEIAPNFGLFLSSHVLGDGPSKSCTLVIILCIAARHREKFRENTPTSLEVIGLTR